MLGGWTTDLLVVDAEELRNYTAQDIHVTRFNEEEVGVQNSVETFVLSCASGSMKQS